MTNLTRRRLVLACTLIVSAVVLLAFFFACRYSYDLESDRRTSRSGEPASTDGSWSAALGEFILPLLEEHDTEWSAGYSDDVFRSLPLGTDKAEVERRLGTPLETKEFPDGNTCWYYSRPGEASSNYFVRVLEFGESGSLLARRAYFHVD